MFLPLASARVHTRAYLTMLTLSRRRMHRAQGETSVCSLATCRFLFCQKEYPWWKKLLDYYAREYLVFHGEYILHFNFCPSRDLSCRYENKKKISFISYVKHTRAPTHTERCVFPICQYLFLSFIYLIMDHSTKSVIC